MSLIRLKRNIFLPRGHIGGGNQCVYCFTSFAMVKLHTTSIALFAVTNYIDFSRENDKEIVLNMLGQVFVCARTNNRPDNQWFILRNKKHNSQRMSCFRFYIEFTIGLIRKPPIDRKCITIRNNIFDISTVWVKLQEKTHTKRGEHSILTNFASQNRIHKEYDRYKGERLNIIF